MCRYLFKILISIPPDIYPRVRLLGQFFNFGGNWHTVLCMATRVCIATRIPFPPNLGRKAVRYLFYDKISHVTCSTFMKRNVMLIVYLILIIRIYCKVKYMGIRETLNAADSRSKPQWIRLFSFNLYTCKTKEAMYAETLS